ncbi:MAG: hypothetical protein KUL86_06615 [Castellaniella sp.]|nr:hypothetical protein [Castellaniella sp.]
MVDFDSVNSAVHGVFSEAAIFTPRGGFPLAVVGIFFNGHTQAVSLGDGSVGVNTVRPVLVVRTAQFPSAVPAQGDAIRVLSNGGTYVIADAQPDGVSEMRLELQRTDPV